MGQYKAMSIPRLHDNKGGGCLHPQVRVGTILLQPMEAEISSFKACLFESFWGKTSPH